jgi:hypothetical protein
LSIATSPREAAGGRPPVLDALEVARLFRDHFGLRFSEHIVCSDAAPAAHDLAISLRGAGLSDIQRALQDILRSMVASHEGGKRLSLLLHLNMQLSSSGDASASEAGSSPFPFEAGSSDALVAASLRLYKLTHPRCVSLLPQLLSGAAASPLPWRGVLQQAAVLTGAADARLRAAAQTDRVRRPRALQRHADQQQRHGPQRLPAAAASAEARECKAAAARCCMTLT